MLLHTFVHLPGIGAKTERGYWDRGIKTWEQALGAAARPLALPGFEQYPASGEGAFARGLAESKVALRNYDANYFLDHLPSDQLWRALDDFRSSTVYLDIETTGLSRVYHRPTIVGCFDGRSYSVGIAGSNLDDIRAPLRKAAVLVTFNGTTFDAPFLRAHLPDLELPPIHIDLRFLLRRLGLSGGLKSIEQQLDIHRPVEGDGRMAVDLWYRYQYGDTDALRQLVTYNYYDTVVLQSLADYACGRLSRQLSPAFSDHPHGQGLAEYEAYEEPHIDALLGRLSSERTTSAQRTEVSLPKNPARIVGIDLTGSEQRATGWAVLQGGSLRTARLSTDEELIAETLAEAPDLVSIDSPLSVPPGTTFNEDGSIKSFECIYRASELELKRRGVSVFWCLLPTMQGLTLRGMRLARALRAKGLRVIESFPGAAQDILSMPRKGKSVAMLAQSLERLGLSAQGPIEDLSHDELDAITSAIVGLFYLTGQFEALGASEENDLIVPVAK